MVYFLYIDDIFGTKMIYHGYFQNMNAFIRVYVTFYDAVNMIHDVITIANQCPYTAKFMSVGVRNNKTQQIIR